MRKKSMYCKHMLDIIYSLLLCEVKSVSILSFFFFFTIGYNHCSILQTVLKIYPIQVQLKNVQQQADEMDVVELRADSLTVIGRYHK